MPHFTDEREFIANGVDLSASVLSLEYTAPRTKGDVTTTQSKHKVYILGKSDPQLTVELLLDYGPGSVHATLAGMEGEKIPLIFKPKKGGTTKFSGLFSLEDFTQIPGGTGDDIAKVSASFAPSGEITVVL